MGGYKTGWGGGACEVLPFRESEKSFSHAEVGGITSFGVVSTRYLEVLDWGARKVLPCLGGGGGRKKFRTRDFPIL